MQTATGHIHILYDARIYLMPLASNVTVGYARRWLGQHTLVPSHTAAVLDGVDVTDTAILQDGQFLCFCKGYHPRAIGSDTTRA